MSNLDKNTNDDFVPFDSVDLSDADYEGEYDPEYREQESLEETRGQSDLKNQKKLQKKGQRALLAFLILAGLGITSAMAFRAWSTQNELLAKSENTQPSASFNKPQERTFGEQFQDVKVEEYNAFDENTEEVPEPVSVLDQVEPPPPAPSPPYQYEAIEPIAPPSPPPSPQVANVPSVSYYEPPPQFESVTEPEPIAPPIEVVELPPTAEELREERIYRSGFNMPKNSNQTPSSANVNSASSGVKKAKDPLVEGLTAAKLSGSSASQMRNRDMVITKGNMIDCVLDTKFDSTVVGMLGCTVTRNIYSSSGRVVLIDRGSRITGQYKGGLSQGQNRVFVVWDRVETPKGVIIDINSPGAGSLGESGLTGRLDNKFWARFGGAILVSLITDAGKALSEAAAEKAIGGNVTLENSSETATEMSKAALEKSINIPPSLVKHQGDKLNIYVSRDLYFGDVYDLVPTNN